MTEPRFTEQDAQQILRLAAERSVVRAGGGFTLRELQEIGQEVGLSPEAIAGAALELSAGAGEGRLEVAGLPVGVTRVVLRATPLRERDWERLVARLQVLVDAKGKEKRTGDLRTWRHGDLRVIAEPVGTGERITFAARKGSAGALAWPGLLWLFACGMLASVLAVFGDPSRRVLAALVTGVAGALVGVGLEWWRLRRWAAERQRQLAAVAESLPTAAPLAAPSAALEPAPAPSTGARAT